MKKITLCCLISGCVSTLAFAEEDPVDLSKVTVTANKTAKALAEVTSKTSVITEEDIEKYNHRNIQDLVRYEPGVVVPGTGRYGLSGFNIRGIGGDRILTLVDGVPIADEFSFGPNLSARRNFVDLDALKAVEIVRGPASSLYGSNAIGGMVTFISKDPKDYLRGDRSQFTSVKLGHDDVNNGFNAQVTFAIGNERHQGMVAVSHRDSEATETYFSHDDTTGPDRKAANPIDQTQQNILAKWAFTPNEDHELKFTVEKYQADIDTDALSQAGTVVYGTLKQSVTAEDTRDRDRYGIQYSHTAGTWMGDEMNINVYTQDSDSTQKTFEARLTPAQQQQGRSRDSLYEQENSGIKINWVKTIDSALPQQWVYGFDYDVADITTLREGKTWLIDSGDDVPETSHFPTRDFPNSAYKTLGFYVQNEVAFFDHKLYVTPGLRYDRFELTPKVDEIYLSGNTGSPAPAGYDESEISAKLGLLWQINDQWSLFGQFAEGFKAPPMDAVNTGFTNFAGGYTAIPNPDLVPESSKSVEFGVRYVGEVHQFEASIYRNRFDDFIETLAFKGFNPVTGLLEFQARNLDETTIKGFEFRGFWDLSQLKEGLRLQYAYANSEGEDDTTGLPLNSVQPDALTVGLGYDAEQWRTELLIRANAKKTDIDDSGIQPQDPTEPAINPFQTPSFTVLDWVGHYQFNPHVRINWGVYNLTEKKHWQWNDVLLQAEGSAGLDRLTQPGRNAAVTLKLTF